MKFAQLTAPDGDPVFVNPDAVQMVRLNDGGRAIAKAKAVILFVSGGTQGVVEDIAIVISRLEESHSPSV
ncbi:hypothetical protein Q3C01_44135 [Bradyrhizobium sp. UFLA05-109]